MGTGWIVFSKNWKVYSSVGKSGREEERLVSVGIRESFEMNVICRLVRVDSEHRSADYKIWRNIDLYCKIEKVIDTTSLSLISISNFKNMPFCRSNVCLRLNTSSIFVCIVTVYSNFSTHCNLNLCPRLFWTSAILFLNRLAPGKIMRNATKHCEMIILIFVICLMGCY